MLYSSIHSPRLQAWQSRLSRMPRWGWIALFIGVVLPLVVLGLGLLAVAVISGIIVLGAAALVAVILGAVRRLLHRHADDGRRNVRIVVRSARVIDP